MFLNLFCKLLLKLNRVYLLAEIRITVQSRNSNVIFKYFVLVNIYIKFVLRQCNINNIMYMLMYIQYTGDALPPKGPHFTILCTGYKHP